MKVAPSGMSACCMLLSAICRPRAPKKERMFSTICSSRRSATFMTSAMASRVMSSWVGPSPPHTMTASLRASADRMARTMRAWLSPTLVWKCESIPISAKCSPIHDELVSTIWPSRSSVPTATTSQRTLRPPAVEQILDAGHEGQDDCGPEDGRGHPTVIGRQREERESHGHLLHDGLHLRPATGGHRDALTADVGAVGADHQLPHSDER